MKNFKKKLLINSLTIERMMIMELSQTITICNPKETRIFKLIEIDKSPKINDLNFAYKINLCPCKLADTNYRDKGIECGGKEKGKRKKGADKCLI